MEYYWLISHIDGVFSQIPFSKEKDLEDHLNTHPIFNEVNTQYTIMHGRAVAMDFKNGKHGVKEVL